MSVKGALGASALAGAVGATALIVASNTQQPGGRTQAQRAAPTAAAATKAPPRRKRTSVRRAGVSGKPRRTTSCPAGQVHEYDVGTAACIESQTVQTAPAATPTVSSRCTYTEYSTFCTAQVGDQTVACTPVDSYVASDGSVRPKSICWLGPMAGKTTAGKCADVVMPGGDDPASEILIQYGHVTLPFEECQ